MHVSTSTLRSRPAQTYSDLPKYWSITSHRRIFLCHVADYLPVAVVQRIVVGLLEANQDVSQLHPPLNSQVGLRQQS